MARVDSLMDMAVVLSLAVGVLFSILIVAILFYLSRKVLKAHAADRPFGGVLKFLIKQSENPPDKMGQNWPPET